MRAVIIAGGPSLTQEDVDRCAGSDRRIYCVNDAYRMAPWAEVLYACDGEWWEKHGGVPAFDGERWTASLEASRKYGLRYISGDHDAVFSAQQGYIAYGGNSGFQALNLAYLQGMRDIVLLGFDMGVGADGKTHWFGDHPREIRRPSNYSDWVRRFNLASPVIQSLGCKVVNCSRRTALECFPRMDLGNALKG